MDPEIAPSSIGLRFHRPAAPTVVACGGLRQPILFSHVASEVAMPAPTLAPPVEDAFALHVHHAALASGDIWVDGRHRPLPRVSDGGIFIWDLRGEPTAQIHERFEFSRFHLPRAALDDLAYEHGLRHPGDLRAATCAPDPVVKNLALAMVRRLALHGVERDSLFWDSISLALFFHVADVYGGARLPQAAAGPLPPWQVRRLTEWMDAHLGESISVADLAGLLGLSRSYFSRAFTRTLGAPPHRWLLQRRIERARQLLAASSMSLSEIAAACGFVDQSHFTSVFVRAMRQTPARWRRQAR